MKILHTVEFYYPSTGGMQEVARQLSERLVNQGHDVSVATTKLPERKENELNGVKIVEFDISGNAVMGFAGEAGNYQEFLLESEFDVITNFAAQQWATDLMLPLLDRISAVKIFVPEGFSGLFVDAYSEYFKKMPRWMEQYDMNVFHSDVYRDIGFARNHGVQKRILIPNGSGSDEFSAPGVDHIRKKLGIPEETVLILHVGSHSGMKGHSETLRIFNRANITDASLVIVGNKPRGGCFYRCQFAKLLNSVNPPARKRRKSISMFALKRDEVVALYHEADLFLFPSNIECSPLVLFECMASKTPFLTTDVGNAAEIIEWSRGGRLLPTIISPDGRSIADLPGSVALLEEMVRNTSGREEMGNSGFKAWSDRFSWEVITNQYEQLYRSLIEEKKHG